MIDILEDFMRFRKIKFFRLDGQTSLAARRDMVSEFQTNPEYFVFLLSTRAGGLGINLTSADTVIFYDNDWNPTMDAQAMDRVHRIGQTKQVTIYRLVCKNTVEERILKRAQIKDTIQKTVYSGEFKMQKKKHKTGKGRTGGKTQKQQKQRRQQNEDDDEDDEAVAAAASTGSIFRANELRELVLSDEEDEGKEISAVTVKDGDSMRDMRGGGETAKAKQHPQSAAETTASSKGTATMAQEPNRKRPRIGL